MKETWMILMVFLIVFMACKDESGDTDIPPEVPVSGDLDILSEVPEGAQAVSLRGESLFSRDPSEDALAKLEEARKAYEADSESADNLIWYGRRMAYTGDYREAIRIYTEGIRKFPDDARIYRHRGHRYISIREFDRSIEDYEKAATLIEGTEDQIEPDGMPNAQNIPVSSLHTNIWYHLALAYYLNHDLENALRVNRKGIEASTNDDMFVATMHWLYMTLRLMEMDDEAERARTTKGLAGVEKQIAGKQAKLGNEKFLANAKPQIVEAERERLSELLSQQAALQAHLAELED